VMDVTNPTDCRCASDGACHYGTATNTTQCYGATVTWGL
jgi:hypothetical protein